MLTFEKATGYLDFTFVLIWIIILVRKEVG